MNENFYTFFIPIIFELNKDQYLVWGYREVNDEIVSFSASLSKEQKWTEATSFDDKILVEEFKKHLPDSRIKKKRRKK